MGWIGSSHILQSNWVQMLPFVAVPLRHAALGMLLAALIVVYPYYAPFHSHTHHVHIIMYHKTHYYYKYLHMLDWKILGCIGNLLVAGAHMWETVVMLPWACFWWWVCLLALPLWDGSICWANANWLLIDVFVAALSCTYNCITSCWRITKNLI